VVPAADRKQASSGISLGRILGIKLNIDASWLLIFAMISSSIFASLTSDYPGRPPAYYWIAALAASLVFVRRACSTV
jgi:hypothetical protein